MPTEAKIKTVDELRGYMERCTIAVSTDFTGLSVDDMTDLRNALREKGVLFRVIKNRLAYLAADAAGRPEIKEIVQGPTGIAFGDGDPLGPAKALADFIRESRSPLKIRGAVMGDRQLTAEEVGSLARLPSKEVLIGQLMSQLQGPMAGLVQVLIAPISGLARVLQGHVDNAEQ